MEERHLRSLLKRYQQGEQEIGQELVLLVKPLVSALARRIALSKEYEDIFQAGMIGLLKAADRFNLDSPVKFTTYAVPWIKGEMCSCLQSCRSPVKVSRALRAQLRELSSHRKKLLQEIGHEPGVLDLARAMSITPEEVAMILEAFQPAALLEGNELPLTPDQSPETELVNRIILYEGILRLAPMERRLIKLRFFEEKTQQEIANRLALSQRQVSRIEKRILWQLRQYLSQ